jgi:hypothetical protein
MRITTFLCFLLWGIYASAQPDKITIVLLKGKASIENSNLKVELKKSNLIALEKNATITLSPNSAIIAYNKKANFEIGSTKEQKLTYTQISNSLNKIKTGSLSSNFLAYLDKLYTDVEKKNNSSGATVGAASRGIEDEIPQYSPNDETIILSDTLQLNFGSEGSKLTSNIVITNESTKELVYNSRPIKNFILLESLKPGNYSWEYKIESLDKKSYQFKNTFLVPALAEKEAKLKEIKEFKDYLNVCKECLSEEGKQILYNDFLEKNKFYLK